MSEQSSVLRLYKTATVDVYVIYRKEYRTLFWTFIQSRQNAFKHLRLSTNFQKPDLFLFYSCKVYMLRSESAQGGANVDCAKRHATNQPSN